MTMNVFACVVLLSAIPLAAQNAPVSIGLTDKSNVPREDILRSLKKECPNVSIANGGTKTDYTLEVIRTKARQGIGIFPEVSFDLTLRDRDGNVFSSVSTDSLRGVGKDTCHAIKTFVMIEVVDTQNLTLSSD